MKYSDAINQTGTRSQTNNTFIIYQNISDLEGENYLVKVVIQKAMSNNNFKEKIMNIISR